MKRDIYKPRPYRHFDRPLNRSDAQKLASDPTRVQRLGFYPFLSRVISTPRYKKGKRKVEDKDRKVAYAAHLDSVIYGHYGAILSDLYERRLAGLGIQAAPVAYRRFPGGKCNVHFAFDAFTFIRENRPCVALGFDVKQFFDNIDHELLLREWRLLLGQDRLPDDHFAVYKSLTRWAWVDEVAVYRILKQKKKQKGMTGVPLCSPADFRTLIRGANLVETNKDKFGIPQGSPMSAILSNVYMLAFDADVAAFAAANGGFYQRYCDDIFLIVKPDLRDAAIQHVMAAAAERRIVIHEEAGKFDEVQFPDPAGTPRVQRPIQYLGLTFDGERTLLRSSTLSRYHGRLKRYIRNARIRSAKNQANHNLYRKKLHSRFTHKGSRNLISYARRCVTLTGSSAIRRQIISRHGRRVHRWSQ